MTNKQKHHIKELEVLKGGIISMPIYSDDDFMGLTIYKGHKKYNLWFTKEYKGYNAGSYEIDRIG